MITRIGAAVLALIWVHGWDNAARDMGETAVALRDGAPRAALELCAAHAGPCQETAIRVVTGTLASKAQPAQKPAIDQASEATSLPTPVAGMPLPPRRPRG